MVLKKGLYGLVQVGRTWNEELNTHMVSVGYTVTPKGTPVYVKGTWGCDGVVAGGFWVDNFIGVGNAMELKQLVSGMDAKYGITGLGEVQWMLGMLVERDCDT